MKKRTIKLSLLLAITVGLFITACSNDEWDRHYNNTDVVLSNQSLSEIIKNDPNLTIFYRLMEISGYDKVLSSPQTFTVWAPLNSDPTWKSTYEKYIGMTTKGSISGVDSLAISKLVGNHISRFTYTTAGLDSQRLNLLCNKIQDFKLIHNAAYFGKTPLGSEVNIPARNGILHTLSGFNPYVPSHWEFLKTSYDLMGLDSLMNYFNSYIYEDQFGNVTNDFFNNFAELDRDDSTYTVIALSNIAWENALNRAVSYHKVFGDTKGLNYKYSRRAIINDLFFSHVSDPTGLDSIVSTSNSVFHNVSDLFVGATKYQLSNGQMYVTDSLRMKAINSWHRKIVVEAEKNTYGRVNSFSDLFVRSYIGSSFPISDGKYVYLKSTGTSNSTGVSLSLNIPNVLSAKYNLYVVFVPERIENKYSPKPSRANVKITYRNARGTVPVSPTLLAKDVAISADAVQKVFIKEITFPWCSMYEKDTPLDVKVTIENSVRINETALTRDMRIDCVILEPVE